MPDRPKVLTPAGFARLASGGRWTCPPHLDRINRALMGVVSGRTRRLMVFVPPRHGKSFLISHYFPAYFLGVFPDRELALCSYEADFAAEWGGKARDTLKAFGPDTFGVEVDPSRTASSAWSCRKVGSRFPSGGMKTAGVGGPLTGRGCHVLVIDDPIKNADEANSQARRNAVWDWYTTTARTRLEPGGAVILLMCMTGDTPVLMADGSEKPLKDIRPGDVVATYDAGRISTSMVRNWKNQGPDTIYEIRTISGRIVRANERHPFLVKTGGNAQWIRLRDLKVGDEIVAATPSGGRCVESFAPPMAATSPLNARGIACPITKRLGGRPGFGLHRTIPNGGGPLGSSIGTVSRRPSMPPCTQPRRGNAPSVDYLLETMSVPTGAGNSASITITRPGRSEGCSATTAISWSATGRPRRSSSGPLDTFGTIPDRIVAIVPAGREDVFDIEVEDTENFIAGGLVSHNTRWHTDDLAGRLMEWAARGEEAWTILNFPALAEEDDPLGRAPGEALWPERFDRPYLEATRELDSWAFDALYQGRPRPKGGGLVREEWIRSHLVSAAPADCEWCRFWDFASSENRGDWTSGTLMGRSLEGKYIVKDVKRGRWSPGERDRVMRATADADADLLGQWNYRVRGELQPGAAGKDHATAFSALMEGFDVAVVPASGDKEVRFRPFASQCEAGNVSFEHGDYLEPFIKEIVDFPRGKFDDQVDSTSGAFNDLARTADRGGFSPLLDEPRDSFLTGGL